MNSVDPTRASQKIEQRSFGLRSQIEMERKSAEKFDIAFLAFCVGSLITALVGFATGAIPLNPNQA